MSNQPIVQCPHPALTTVSTELTQEDFDSGEVKRIVEDLIDTLNTVGSRGVGLAANQIGVTKRIFIVRVPKTEDRFYVYVNPVFIKTDKSKLFKGEGCLSIDPKYTYNQYRYQRVKVAFQDENGVHHKLNFSGFEAVCLQHEMDHLNGLLINRNDTNYFKRPNLNARGESEVFTPTDEFAYIGETDKPVGSVAECTLK